MYKLRAMDYAGNTTTYRVLVGLDPTDGVEGVTLSQTSLRMAKGNSKQLIGHRQPDQRA